MAKKIVVVAMLTLLVVLNVHSWRIDAPLWLHGVSWYIGAAIWFSLYVPIRVGRTVDVLEEAGPVARVLVSLVWPLYMLVWLVAKCV